MNVIVSIRKMIGKMMLPLLIVAIPATSLAAFTDVSGTAGLTTNDIRSGVAWGDYNDDGCVDLFVTGRDSNTLNENNCDGTFTDVTAAVGIVEPADDSKGVAWADYDNDGDLDLYVGRKGGANALYRNDAGTFTDVAATAGVNDARQTAGVAWADYDNDGDLDLFIANRWTDAAGDPREDELYRNQLIETGVANFVAVGATLGVAGTSDRKTFAGIWTDYDADGCSDLYLAVDIASGNDFGDNILYHNNCNGTFTDVTHTLLGKSKVWEAQHSMGIAIGDPNGDGCLDMFVTNNTDPHDPNFTGNPFPEYRKSVLHRNNCDNTFNIASTLAGIIDRDMVEWGATFVDYDNDGDQDLAVVAGGTLTTGEPNVLYQNNGGGVFTDVTVAETAQDNGAAWGSAWADYDNDGDLDWAIANHVGDVAGTTVLLRNDAPVANYINVALAGNQSNSRGIGARVEITVGGTTQVRFIQAGESYLSAQPPVASFGLGTSAIVDELRVIWPFSNSMDQCFGLSANQTVIVTEGQACGGPPPLGTIQGTITNPSGTPEPDVSVRLRNLDINQLVGSTTSDANGFYQFNDLNDAQYRVRASKSGFVMVNQTVTVAGGGVETVDLQLGSTGPVSPVQFTDVTDAAGVSGDKFFGETGHSLGVNWIDFNNDLFPDLFLVNGFGFLAHLFQNNGDGTFTRVDELLPALPNVEMSGSRFGDFDNDGDSDIFIAVDNEQFDLHGVNNPDGPPNLLLKNLWVENGGQIIAGQPLFEEIATQAGVQDLANPPFGTYPARRTKTMGLMDYDRDGCLDVFWGQMVLQAPGDAVNSNSLYRGKCDGSGTFEDTTVSSGMDAGTDPNIWRPTLAFTGAHLDNDLWPDMYVCNVHEASPFHHDRILGNNGDGTFTDITGLSPGVGDDSGSCMGVDVADIDLNGTWDIYASDVFFTQNDADPKGNPLYLGNGDGTFADNSAVEAGLDAVFSWAINFFDVDHDTDEDVFVSTKEENARLYINNGGVFENVGLEAGIITPIDLRGAATADFDRDGDLDLAMVKHGSTGRFLLFRNDSVDLGRWLQIKLVGVQSNRDGIGAVVKVTRNLNSPVMMRQVKGGSSAHSQDDLVVHFGVGNSNRVREIIVQWPSGVEDRLIRQDSNQLITIVEGSTGP